MNYYPQLEHEVKEIGGIAAFVENIYENGYENGFKECYALSQAIYQQQCRNKAIACQIITNSLKIVTVGTCLILKAIKNKQDKKRCMIEN